MKTDLISRLFLMVILACAAFSCQQMPTDDAEIADEDITNLKVDVRSAGNAEIVYPLYLYAFDTKGKQVASQILANDDEEMSLPLGKGDFQIVAVSGTSSDYQIPENPELSDVITLVGSKGASTPLMMGRANVEITGSSKSTVKLTLSYVVSALNVKLKDVPSNVEAVQLSLSPLYSTLSMGGKYGGSSHKVKLDCTPVQKEEGVWTANATYIFPGSASETDFSIYFKTDDGIEVTYGHTFDGAPKANYLFNVTGSYAGGIIVGGDFDVTDWEGTINVEFEFGSDIQPDGDEDEKDDTDEDDLVLEGVPEIGTIWNGAIVADIGEADETGVELLLMSLDEWDAKVSDIPYLISGYSVNGISGWRLPTYNEVQVLKARFSGDNRMELNELIDEYDENEELWPLDGEERYFCTKNGAYYTFKFAGGTPVTQASENLSYYTRLVKTYRFSLEQD